MPLRILTGDETLCLLTAKESAVELGAKLVSMKSRDEIEDLLSPFFFEPQVVVWRNPSKDDLALLESVADSIVPDTLSFFNHSQNASSYSWDFGDNHSSTDINPIHIYTAKGT